MPFDKEIKPNEKINMCLGEDFDNGRKLWFYVVSFFLHWSYSVIYFRYIVYKSFVYHFLFLFSGNKLHKKRGLFFQEA